MEYWGNLASIISSFFSIGSLMICLNLYKRKKIRILLWLSVLLSSITAVMMVSSIMIVMEYLFLDRIRGLPGWYDKAAAVVILLLFILHVVYLVVINVSVHIFTSRKKRGVVENGVLILVSSLLLAGFLSWVFNIPLWGNREDPFVGYALLCRDLSFAYILYKLLLFDTSSASSIIRKIRLALIVVIGLTLIVWTFNDTVWLVSQRWLFHFADSFVNLLLTSTILASLVAYILTDSGEHPFGAGPKESIKSDLTLREQDVFDLLIQGCTYQQVSETLHISLDTVKTHIRNIYKKAGVRGKKELVEKYSPPTGQ